MIDWLRRRQRAAMIAHLRAHGVHDARVLDALERVPRHAFVPWRHRLRAYGVDALPGSRAGSPVSAPIAIGLMTQALAPDADARVLEIGTGSGYQSAILATLAARVHTIERVEFAAIRARVRLRALEYHGVHVRAGDGFVGWPEAAPFDRIVLSCSVVEVPSALLEQLASRGRLVAPIGRAGASQDVVAIDRSVDGTFERRVVGRLCYVPLLRGVA
jgi:protein-L-isoaspartate(D-aspartate) O-methyltransferase